MDSSIDIKILRTQGTLMVSLEGSRGASEGAVSQLEAVQPDWAEVGLLADEIARHLTAQRQPRGVLGRLERAGQLLFDQLLGQRVKRALRETRASTLVLHLHTSLLELPWELLHDGQGFLSLRFALGRIAVSEGEEAEAPSSLSQGPLRLLIIADPRGDLPHAEDEGQALVDLALEQGERIAPNLLPSPTARRRVLEALRAYDIVHVAGHGEGGGWLMEDGTLTARDVHRLRGGHLPALLFANACASGTLEGWDPGAGAMARTFLLGGTRHFIGASCELPDHSGAAMALVFYTQLWAGSTVGEAVQRARAHLSEDRTLPPLAWAGYVLYGDPGARYIKTSAMPQPHDEGDMLVVTGGEPIPLVRPPVEAQPFRPARRHTRMTPAERRRLIVRVLLGALLGAAVGLMASLEVGKVLPLMDAAWVATLEGSRGARPFRTPLVLLGVDRRVTHPRALYAGLLEALVQQPGPGPDVVAFDTWFRDLAPGESPTEEDLRLVKAIAGALTRFSVVLGQKWDPTTQRPHPPPAWLLDGVREALSQGSSPGSSQENPPYFERLGLGHVAVERVVEGIFWDLDLRVPFSCSGEAGVPFSWRVAFPRDHQLPVCMDGGFSFGVSSETVSIPLDARGRMALSYRGRAEWGDGPVSEGFKAYDLKTLVEAWQSGATGGMDPSAQAGWTILVGRAQVDAEASDADRRRTPLGELYGVEVQANAVEALRRRSVPAPARPGWVLFVSICAAGLAAGWTNAPRAGVRSLLLAALIGGVSYVLWARWGAWLTPTASWVSLLGVALGARIAAIWLREPGPL